MRYVVIGMGAIGGVLAAHLQLAGQRVVGVARGAHLEAVRQQGLLLRAPGGDERIRLEVASTVEGVHLDEGDVVVLAVKSQDTANVLEQLVAAAPPQTPILCAQNGVANEPEALRWFDSVYGVVVMCPALHLEPGVVAAYSSPTVGILDVGRYPSGEDEISRGVAADLASAGYSSRSVPDIARWKYAKLITNLGNAVEGVCGPALRGGPLTTRLQEEARDVLDHHGIAFASGDEDKHRRGSVLQIRSIDGPRPGGSLWQSLSRGAGTTEVDYLCGEVVRLARLAGLRAPANERMQQLTHDISAGQIPLAGRTEEQVLDMIEPHSEDASS